MKLQDIHIWQGKVHLECTGTQISSFIDQAVKENIHIEDIFWLDEHKIHIAVNVRDFLCLVKCSRRYQIRARITKKRGIPFLWKRVKKRKFFFMGSILFLGILFCMSSVVWRVDIEGTEKVPVSYIREMLKERGVYEGQFKTNLPDPIDIQYDVQKHFPELSWVGFRIEGTRVIITVVEKKRAEIHKSEYPSHGPVHLIATKNALVVDIRAEKGNPLVHVHDTVKAGQILISGVYGDPLSMNGPIVGAQGRVLGEVWYESSVVVPMIQKRKVFTGERKKSRMIHIAGQVIRNPFSAKTSFSEYETAKHFHYMYLGNWKLPCGWVEEEYLEREYVIKKLDVKQAVELGKDLCRRSLKGTLGVGGKIQEEKILQEVIKNGTVYLQVHFDAIENIAVPQPILRGE